MSIDPEKVLETLSSGKAVPSEEIEEICAELEECLVNIEEADLDFIYPRLFVLSKRGFDSDKKLLAKFLYTKDPITAALALKAICTSREEVEERFEEIQNLALGVSWDQDGDLQVTALEALRFVNNQDSIRILFSVFEDEDAPYSSRLASYRILLEFAQKNATLSPFKRISFEPGSTDIDWDALLSLRS